MKNLIVLMLSFASLNAFAKSGDRVGNGGDVVICGDKVELLDIYEAKSRGQQFLKFKSDEYQEIVRELIEKRLKPLQPKRAATYLNNLKTFSEEARVLPGIHLNDVDDSGLVAIPTGCKLEQIVVQLKESDIPAGGNRYTVSADLWNKLDNFNQAALTLHELIYREAIENDSASSMVVRSMVGQLLKKEMNLEIYYGLDNSLSRYSRYENFRSVLEFGNTAVITMGPSKFNLETNQDNETILTINARALSYYLSDEKPLRKLVDRDPLYAASTFKIRLNDMKLMSMYDGEGLQTGKLVTAGEEYKYTPSITLVPDQTIFINKYRANSIVKDKTKEFNLRIFVKFGKNQERTFDIQRVTQLSLFDTDIEEKEKLNLYGSFEFEAADGIRFSKPLRSNQSAKFDLQNEKLYSVLSEEYINFSTEDGDVRCKGFSRKEQGERTYTSCARTSAGYTFTLSRKGMKDVTIPFNLKADSEESFSLTGKSVLTSYHFPTVVTAKSIFLGKSSGIFKKDIYLPAGEYRIQRTGNDSQYYAEGIMFVISSKDLEYLILKDGTVKASKK